MMKKLNIVVISDIHFGIKDTKKMYENLKKVFLPYLKKKNELDMIVIAGDLLDHKISFNSEISKFIIEFINELINIAINKNSKIRILRGTRNHDLDQLNNFLYLELREDVDFKIISTVREEIIENKVKILYLPEEYMDNKEEFYQEYFSKQYDLCFFHGTFKHESFKNQDIYSEKPIKDAPIFTYNELVDVIKGPIIGGHIHRTSIYKQKIYYTGSFYRWAYGEEKSKGFIDLEYNISDSSFNVEFIKNKLAPKYITVDLKDIITEECEVNERINLIKKYKKEHKIKNLRIKLDSKLISEDNEAELKLLKDYFSNEEDIKLDIKNNLRTKEEIEDENDELDFLNNEKLSIDKMISLFLEKKENIFINEKDIEEIFSE